MPSSFFSLFYILLRKVANKVRISIYLIYQTTKLIDALLMIEFFFSSSSLDFYFNHKHIDDLILLLV